MGTVYLAQHPSPLAYADSVLIGRLGRTVSTRMATPPAAERLVELSRTLRITTVPPGSAS